MTKDTPPTWQRVARGTIPRHTCGSGSTVSPGLGSKPPPLADELRGRRAVRRYIRTAVQQLLDRSFASVADDEAYAGWLALVAERFELRDHVVRRRFGRSTSTVGEVLDTLVSESPLPDATLRRILADLGYGAAVIDQIDRVDAGRRAGRRPQRLADGTLGWAVRDNRADDCFTAAVATCLQVPIEEIPDPAIDSRLAAGETIEEIDTAARDQFERWLASRDLEMVLHRNVPARRLRWIGVVPLRGAFNDHCLVMSRDALLFDPSGPTDFFTADDVRFGLSFRARSTTPNTRR